uniref:Small ribosomal subunit protein uS14 n=2 Tax=Sus scrofa TaxID=9823 RepID=A0A8W4FDJ7_PIG
TGHQQLCWSHPRKFGQGSRSCQVCSYWHGLIQKYGLNMCCWCFCQYSKDIATLDQTLGMQRRNPCHHNPLGGKSHKGKYNGGLGVKASIDWVLTKCQTLM